MDIDTLHTLIADQQVIADLGPSDHPGMVWQMRLHPAIAAEHATDVAHFVAALTNARKVEDVVLHRHDTILLAGYTPSVTLRRWTQQWWERHGGTWPPHAATPDSDPDTTPRRTGLLRRFRKAA